MEWINDNVGLLLLIVAAVLIILAVVAIVQNHALQRKIAAQRLNFLGMYSKQAEPHEPYAKLVVGNKSLIDFGFTEIGVCNGKVTVDLTKVYREKKGIPDEVRLSIEQKNAIELCLTAQELKEYVLSGGTQKMSTLSLYVLDTSGKIYTGKIRKVRKLLAETLKAEKLAAKAN